ncbi:MAG: class I SAM-dependent RNA methyltransferase [Verrucomicrobia bacterium]|jgi:tRNA/tmRNA/rRNA uracil-C5-methylase (TrmA/RlmC/RlmD family)|nr:class I SAM-dependent RNA methyltransferase [Verrucomicrobiota bacterium]
MGKKRRRKPAPPALESHFESTDAFSKQIGDQVELEISDVAFGGEGVGRHEGFVIFVPYVIAGEKVEVRITEIHKKFARAELLQVLKASTHRTEAECGYYEECGGCQYQHIDYKEQLRIKHKQVSDLFERIGGQSKDVVLPVAACPTPFHYRNRIMVRTQYNRETKAMNVGFLRNQSRLVVDIPECKIAEPDLNQALQEVRVDPPRKNGIKFTLRVYPEQWNLPPDSFFQVNFHQLPNMINAVADLLKDAKTKYLIDAYCGVGFFSLSLAEKVESYVGVEVDHRAILSARKNAESMQKTNGSFIQAPTEEVIDELVEKFQPSMTTIILDPPRKGCHASILEVLLRTKPKQIIYVSCHPATLSRDVKALCSNGLFKVNKVAPLDMFPQTQHVECITDIRLVEEE